MSAVELSRAYAAKRLSPVEVARAVIARAETIDERFNAFTEIDAAGALETAKEAESRWLEGKPLSPIDGVPTTIKDIVWVRGKTISYGSRASEPILATRDAPSVARLRKAGAVFVGLTATPELGWKAVTDSPLTGLTTNPWDDSLTPGGSSGGAAVAASTGAGALHLGTDGGGSIRIPASFTGVVGFKPTFGKVAAYPASPFGTLAHIGPIARSVPDAKLMLDAMAGRDSIDWNQPPVSYPARTLKPVNFSGLRIAYWRTPPCGRLDVDVARCCDEAANRLAGAGANVEPLNLPDMDLLAIFNVLWLSGAARRLRTIAEDRRQLLDPGLRDAAAFAEHYSAADFVDAQLKRTEFGAWMESLFERYHLVVSPATSIAAFEKGYDVPPGSGQAFWTEWAGFSFPVNLSQQPACVVPLVPTPGNRPVGLQFVGARGDDDRVLEFAEAFSAISA